MIVVASESRHKLVGQVKRKHVASTANTLLEGWLVETRAWPLIITHYQHPDHTNTISVV